MMLKLGREYKAEASEGMRIGERGSGVGQTSAGLQGARSARGFLSLVGKPLRPGERVR